MSDDFDLRGILQDSVTRLLTDLSTKDVIDRAEQGVWPDRIWDALEEAGLTRTLVPEEAGGAGGTWGTDRRSAANDSPVMGVAVPEPNSRQ